MLANLRREVEMEYEARRAQNRAEEARRLAKASEADPEIGRLVRQRTDMFRACAQAAFANPEEAHAISQALQEEIAAMHASLGDRLAKAGFPKEYLQPVYQCVPCRDTGFVGEPIQDQCACFARRLRDKLIADTGHGLHPDETFGRYNEAVYSNHPFTKGKPDTQRAFMSRMRERCEAYAESFPQTPQRNILMFGKSGLGKTFLMNCIGNRVRQRGFEALKITAYQLTDRMRASIFDHNPYAFSLLLEAPLLLLDDLGAEPLIKNITIEQLFTLLNERALGDRHTVISTNLELDELTERYTERVCSRLLDHQNTRVFNFVGTDVRLTI